MAGQSWAEVNRLLEQIWRVKQERAVASSCHPGQLLLLGTWPSLVFGVEVHAHCGLVIWFAVLFQCGKAAAGEVFGPSALG